MDYEKKYKEALARASKLRVQNPFDTVSQMMEHVFPELAEPEDERVRKWIIDNIRYNMNNGSLNNSEYKKKAERAIAWLEKQGNKIEPKFHEGDTMRTWKDDYEFPPINVKQRPNDKVEPKFHEGDWIVNRDVVYHIDRISGVYLTLSTLNGTALVYHISVLDSEHTRLWTVKEAKDGDVLVDVYGNIGIYEKHDDFDWMSYCSLGHNGGFQHFKIEHENEKTIPATKEQRDLLFQKMKEAGYTFDFEKKELKKIEQEDEEYNGEDYGIDSLYHAQRILEKTLGEVDGYQSDDGILSHKCAITELKKLYKQKPTEWSEEDDDALGQAIIAIEDVMDDHPNNCYTMYKLPFSKVIEQLKSLRERIKN